MESESNLSCGNKRNNIEFICFENHVLAPAQSIPADPVKL